MQKESKIAGMFVFLFFVAISILRLLDFYITKIFDTQINQKIVFGLLADNYTGLILNLIFLILFYIFTVHKKQQLSLFLVLLGGMSNIFDRIIYGGVRDYFFIKSMNIYFNLADLVIIFGLTIFIFKYNKKTPSNNL